MSLGNKLFQIFTALLLLVCAEAGTISPRVKRGASVYPVFPSGGGNSHNPYSSNDPTSFIHYLGGTGGISSRRSGSQGSASTYSSTSVPAPSGGGSSYTPQSSSANYALDSNLLNTYSQSSHARTSPTPPSTSGWSPSSSYGYSGSFYTTDYGHLTPNFASHTSPTPSYSRPHLPSLNANSLLHSAQTTFQAQNHLYDILLASGPRPQGYKGSSGY